MQTPDGLIIFASPELCIFSKPSLMSVHNESPSLAEAVKARLSSMHFVNRLDRDTSGLVLATPQASLVQELTQALHQSDSAQKIYRGLVPRPREWDDEKARAGWLWQDALSDKAEGRKNPLGLPKDQIAAATQARMLSGNAWFLDLEFLLLTGRQHQIRKHCAFHRIPIVNDDRYGREGLNQKVQQTYQIQRMMLHAWKLNFHWRGKDWHFEAPLPAEFAQLLAPES